MNMFNPEKYNKHNKMQARDNLQYLQEYVKKAQWRHNCKTIIDIGSGDGSFTKELSKLLPYDYKMVIGCDKNKEMVKFANKYYASERISYNVLDIGETLPEDLYGFFDHAFSFYTLQLVQDQEKVFSNIYNLLAPKGACLLVILSSAPSYFDIYRLLSKSMRWRQWLGDVEKVISVYHDCEDPKKKVMDIMTKVGFTDINVTIEKKKYVYKDIEDCKMAIKAVNLFPIPEHELEDYVEEFIKVTQELGYMDKDFNFEYKLILAHAKKN